MKSEHHEPPHLERALIECECRPQCVTYITGIVAVLAFFFLTLALAG